MNGAKTTIHDILRTLPAKDQAALRALLKHPTPEGLAALSEDAAACWDQYYAQPSEVPMPPGQEPLRWQEEAMRALRVYAGSHQNILFSAATGVGKGTFIASLMVKAARAKKRCLFIVHRDELIDDVMQRATLIEPNLYAGKVKAERNEMDRFSVFASQQSLRGKRLATIGRFDYVITDEVHRAGAKTYRAIYDKVREVNPRAKHFGFTATPFRNTGGGKTKGLGEVFEVLAYEYSLSEAIADGVLAPIRCLSIETDLDLSDVDPDDEEKAAKIVDTPDRNRVVVAKYREHLTEVDDEWSEVHHPAIAFCASVDHAVHLAEAFQADGIKAEAVWESSKNQGKDKERARKIADYKAGRIAVLCNRDLLAEGFDAPATRGVILAGPTESLGLFCQRVGRGTRRSPATGKTEGLVLDFVAASTTHNLVTVADLTRPTKNPRIEVGATVRHRRRAELSEGIVMGLRLPGGGAPPATHTEDGRAIPAGADPAGTDPAAVDPDEWIADVLWRVPRDPRMRAAFDADRPQDVDGAEQGEAEDEAGERRHRCAELVQLRAPRRAREEMVAPSVIGVREYAVTLFDDEEGKGGGKVAWYTYTTSTGAKVLLARGTVSNAWPAVDVSVLLQHAVVHGEGERGKDQWEAWRRETLRENGEAGREHARRSLTRIASGSFAVVRDIAIEAVRMDGCVPVNWREPWMKQAATDAQRDLLRSFRIDGERASRGEASMLIEIRFMRNAVQQAVKAVGSAIKIGSTIKGGAR